jgi:hypothetical protein
VTMDPRATRFHSEYILYPEIDNPVPPKISFQNKTQKNNCFSFCRGVSLHQSWTTRPLRE